MSGLIAIAALICLVAIVRPFKPFARRSQALIAFFLLLMVQAGIQGAKQNTSTQIVESPNTSASSNAVDKVKAPEAQWDYSEEKDEMRAKPIKYACITADNILHFSFPYGDETATLCLRNHPEHGKNVILSISHGQFLCNSYEGCSVNVKFSRGAVGKYSAVGPADYGTTTLFIQNYPRFVQSLVKSDMTYVEAQFYQEGRQQIKFNTKGLDPSKIQ